MTDRPEPLVSIVTPSLQHRRFLDACLESVASQQGVRVEHLVFDGGSQDGSADVLREAVGLAGWWSEPDRGQAHAINKGLARARGDILGFLNSDDVLLPNALQRVAEVFAADPGVDLVYGNAHYIDERGSIQGAYLTRSWDDRALEAACFVCQPAAFWSRRIFEKIGYFDESLHCSIDYDYWLRIVRAGGKVAFVEDFLACSRDHAATKTRSRRADVFRDNIRLQLKRLGFVHEQWWFEAMMFLRDESGRALGRWMPRTDAGARRLARFLSAVSRGWPSRRCYREPLRGS